MKNIKKILCPKTPMLRALSKKSKKSEKFFRKKLKFFFFVPIYISEARGKAHRADTPRVTDDPTNA